MRGKGIGLKLLKNCLKSAKSFNFNKCYIETIPSLIRAIKLYKSNGFDTLSSPLGSTGHNNCKIWMIKDLK
jgi:putative acetyltransferase